MGRGRPSGSLSPSGAPVPRRSGGAGATLAASLERGMTSAVSGGRSASDYAGGSRIPGVSLNDILRTTTVSTATRREPERVLARR